MPPPRAGLNLLRSAPAPGEERGAYNASVYDNVWTWINRSYYDANFNGVDWVAARNRHKAAAVAAKTDEELYKAINVLLNELNDRHTHAATREEFSRVFLHVNAVVGLRSMEIKDAPDRRRKITHVFPGGPAALAGVRAGWILVSCNGLPPFEVLGPGKLKEGQVVQCAFLDESGEARVLALKARRMSVPPFRSVSEPEPGVYVLRFDAFDMSAVGWLRSELTSHRDAKGIVLDLRYNNGGHVFALGSALGDVFSKKVSTGHLVHRGTAARWHRSVSQRGGAQYAGPLAVLVSENTASAAEIFAQLIQDHGRGVVIGEETMGAVLTSIFWPLAGGGKLQFSVYDYRSPKGHRMEGRGVIPDFRVENSSEQPDAVVTAALKRLRENRADSASPSPSK